MPERIRYHLDENVDPAVARALRRHGIDVTTSKDAGLDAQTDDAHLQHAQREGRVIFTHDTDFLRMASEVADHAGIAYCHTNSYSIGKIVEALILVYEVLSPEEMAGRVEFL